MKKPKRKAKNLAVKFGTAGGKVSSEAKTKAARENGKKGGRPRIVRETFEPLP